MIVIVIVGISAAMVAPSVMTSMSSGRTSRCQYDSARLLRSARSEAIATGRAHLVDFDNGSGRMILGLFRGDSSSCARATWAGIVGVDAPIDFVRAVDYSLGGHSVVITVTTAGAAAPQQVCFEPDGDRFERPNRTGVFVRQPGLTTVAFDRVTPTGVSGDVQRRIVIPQFGAPRVTR
jgi:type II secretory pathway pseudopilin PulG